MIEAARRRIDDNPQVEILRHDLDEPLPDISNFDAIVSCFEIHHCLNDRKKSLYAESYDRMIPNGVFCNLEHVASPTPVLHLLFLETLGASTAEEDASKILMAVETQFDWLRGIGFVNVNCCWKWLEPSLFGGHHPASTSEWPIESLFLTVKIDLCRLRPNHQ